MTRARERLFLSNAKRRRIFGQDQYNSPSRFLEDIPRELLDLEGEEQPGFGFARPAAMTTERTVHKEPAGHNLAAIFQASLQADAPEAEPSNEVEMIPDDSVEGIWIGMKVHHGKFGVGTVRRIEGSGDNQKVTVWFNTVGPKKLLVRFAGLERV
jgi:DNA helicase-2/ATP-dependent DNA helicase PcrA